MKISPLLYSLLIVLLCAGCNKEEKLLPTEITGRWQLVQIIYHTMISGESDVISDPSNLEIYLFRPDSSFVRFHSAGQEISGTYTISQDRGQKVVIATSGNMDLGCHDIDSQLTCFSKQGMVYFKHTEPNTLVTSYIAADGPSFVYKKISSEN